MKTFFRSVTSALVFVALFLNIGTVFAATKTAGTQVSGTLTSNSEWTVDKSPYILTSELTVPSGVTLTIDPGVRVTTDNTIAGLSIYGSLIVNGSIASHVVLDTLAHLDLEDSNASLFTYADLRMHGPLLVYGGNLTIATSTITDIQGSGIYAWRTKIKIDGSSISNNMMDGIYVWSPDGQASDISITGSSIAMNGKSAIENHSPQAVSAINNWWGSSEGPIADASTPNGINGPVQYLPWLTSAPLANGDVCCSSVLFLPGLEASTLFTNTALPGNAIMQDTRWPPSWNGDVQALYLNSKGQSLSNVYSGDPMAKAYGAIGIYDHFLSMLDSLVADNSIQEWKGYGYDWRKPISDIVSLPEQKATTTDNLVQDVLGMASRSKTGKVTIVAHSNGGLVAKYLTKTLSDMGKANLIDTVISVAVPYLGTPQALAGLLHGDGQEIGYGLILKQSVARLLGLNMPSAYSLLPSAQYFAQAFAPTIVFASTTVVGLNDGSYGQAASTANTQTAFVTDSAKVRSMPAGTNVKQPIIGNTGLLAAADVIHSLLDPFMWPSTIARFAILGWNTPTLKTLMYSALNIHTASTTLLGDGTVVVPSAGYNAGSIISADTKQLSHDEHDDINHTNILNASSTVAAVKNIITHTNSDKTSTLPKGLAWGMPDVSGEPGYIEVSTHSPVNLDVYDSQGRHTGYIAAPAGSNIQDDVVSFFETGIPDSHFRVEEGEGPDHETYIDLPDTGQVYSIAIQGIGLGTVDYKVDRYDANGGSHGHAEYDNIPVTPLTTASTTLSVPAASDSSQFLSALNPVIVDEDGDGVVDATIVASSTSSNQDNIGDAVTFLEALKKTVTTLLGSSDSTAKGLIKRLNHVEDLVRQGKISVGVTLSTKLAKKLAHTSASKLPANEKAEIVNEIEAFIAQYQ